VSSFFIFVGCALLALMLPALYRVVAGPTAIDRIVAVNVIGTKTAVMLVVIGTILDRNQNQVAMFVDFALAYALLNFIGSLAAARFFHRMKGRAAVPEGVEADDL
jgi:multicomponent Na+:H+ antiporter subunit F